MNAPDAARIEQNDSACRRAPPWPLLISSSLQSCAAPWHLLAMLTLGMICMLLAPCPAAEPPTSQIPEAPKPALVPVTQGRILVKPLSGVDVAALRALHAQLGCQELFQFTAIGGLEVVAVPSIADLSILLTRYRESGLVQYAEADHEVRLAETFPNDPEFSEGRLWPLLNPERGDGGSGADIDAPRAWDLLTGAPDIVVALLDTGIRYSHEDLAVNVWTNPRDGSHGFNALTGSHDPLDDNGHGTLLAGIIGAVGNNGLGVVGVAWRVKIMACKFVDESGRGRVSDAILALQFARENGARIINASWFFEENSTALSDAIGEARAAGIIVVAAAGNLAKDIDSTPFFPASFAHDNIVSVAATTRTDDLFLLSNFGATNVDLAAPGGDVLSTSSLSDHSYATNSVSTSSAAAYVSGSLALMLAAFPKENYAQILQRLFQGVDVLPGLQGKCVTGGRLNLRKALALPKIAAPKVSPASMEGFSVLVVTGSPGYLHVIQTSSNLVDWAPIYSNTTSGSGSMIFEIDALQKWKERFFRAFAKP